MKENEYVKCHLFDANILTRLFFEVYVDKNKSDNAINKKLKIFYDKSHSDKIFYTTMTAYVETLGFVKKYLDTDELTNKVYCRCINSLNEAVSNQGKITFEDNHLETGHIHESIQIYKNVKSKKIDYLDLLQVNMIEYSNLEDYILVTSDQELEKYAKDQKVQVINVTRESDLKKFLN